MSPGLGRLAVREPGGGQPVSRRPALTCYVAGLAAGLTLCARWRSGAWSSGRNTAAGPGDVPCVTPFDLTPDQLLSTTRAVRKRLDLSRPVERELLQECLDLAFQAPTGGNLQGWHLCW
jgi:hypothetical protein